MPIYSLDDFIPVVAATAYVHPDAVLIGDVIIGPGCYVGPNASLRGDFGRIILEAGSNLQDNCVVHSFPGRDAVIEENGHIGHGAILHGCTIKQDALVGMNCVVMDGAVIGEAAFVGAMSFVRSGFIVPPRTLAVGSPAKNLRELTDDEIIWKANGTRHYHDLARRCLASLIPCEALAAPEPDRLRRPRHPAQHQPRKRDPS